VQLRPFQIEALEALQRPANVICVAPTGSGKSLIYERLARNPGIRLLLVSPLVALARQQRARLGGAARVLSPEALAEPSRLKELDELKPNFLVVDECHCLWDWGERFRPAFREIPRLLKRYSFNRTLWLTATLPPDARSELKKIFETPPIELGRFALPENLSLDVARQPLARRMQTVLDWSEKNPEPGIVFTQTREMTERLARLLRGAGVNACAYHAGLSREERKLLEEQVGHATPQVVVATSAFGMGMDYPHLRWAVLWQAPPSLLALAQAIGRVGRGSEAARALLLWDDDDFQLLEWITRGSEKAREDAAAVAEFARSESDRRGILERYFNGTRRL
jgi:ATP-dependent DNA helicase RecQ